MSNTRIFELRIAATTRDRAGYRERNHFALDSAPARRPARPRWRRERQSPREESGHRRSVKSNRLGVDDFRQPSFVAPRGGVPRAAAVARRVRMEAEQAFHTLKIKVGV